MNLLSHDIPQNEAARAATSLDAVILGRAASQAGSAIPDILARVSKVMISIPDDELRAVDAEAARRRTTRSGLIRQWAREAVIAQAAQRAKRRAAAMALIDREFDDSGRAATEAAADPTRHGGDVAGVVKRYRPS